MAKEAGLYSSNSHMAVETRGRNGMRRLVKLLLGTAAITSFMNVNVSAAAVKEGVESVDPQDGVVKTVASEGDEPQKKSLRASGDKQQEDKESLEKYGDRMYDVLYNLSRSDLPQTVIPRHHFHDGEDLKAEARKKYCDCKKTHCSCSQPILIITEEEITSDEPDECDELPQEKLSNENTISEEVSQSQLVNKNVKFDELPQEKLSNENKISKEVSQSQLVNKNVKFDELPQEKLSNENKISKEVSQSQLVNKNVKFDELPQEKLSNENKISKEVSQSQLVNKNVKFDELPQEKLSNENKISKEVSQSQLVNKNVKFDELPQEKLSNENKISKEVSQSQLVKKNVKFDELPQAQLPTVDKSEENKPRGTVSLADPLYDLEHNKDWGSIIDFDSLYERGRDIKKRIIKLVDTMKDEQCRKMARLLEGDRLLKIPIDLAQKLSVVESDKLPDELIEDLADCIADDLTTEICGPKPVSPISLLPTKESKWLKIRSMMKDHIKAALKN